MNVQPTPQIGTLTPKHGATRLIAILALMVAFGPMSIDMYLPAMPAIAADLGAGSGAVQLTLSAFFLGFAAGQLIYGPMSDRFGRRPIIIGGVALYVISSGFCALSADVDQLVAMRFLHAIGGSAAAVVARATVRDFFAGNEAARALSLIMMIMSAAPLLAPFMGGYLLLWSGWRAIFWVLTGFGTICLVATFLWLQEGNPPERRSRTSWRDVGLNYLRIATDRQAIGCILTSAFAFAGMFTYFAGSPFVFIEIHGVPAEDYGYLFALNVGGLIALGYLNSRLVTRIGIYPMLTAGTVITALSGLALLYAGATGFGGLFGLVIPLFCYISALALIGANGIAGALDCFPRLAGTVSALAGGLQFGIGALAGGLVSTFHADSALPMAAGICATGLACLLARMLLVRTPSA